MTTHENQLPSPNDIFKIANKLNLTYEQRDILLNMRSSLTAETPYLILDRLFFGDEFGLIDGELDKWLQNLVEHGLIRHQTHTDEYGRAEILQFVYSWHDRV